MEEIKQRIEGAFEILWIAKRYTEDSHAMFFSGHSVFNLVNRDRFLSRTRGALWELGVIETAKLLNPNSNDHYGISKLLQDILGNHDQIDWISEISKEEVKGLARLINRGKGKKLVKDLIEMRNQHYAHNDLKPKRELSEIELYYTGLNKLHCITEEILTKLWRVLIDPHYVSQEYIGQDARNFLKEIIEERQELGSYKFKCGE